MKFRIQQTECSECPIANTLLDLTVKMMKRAKHAIDRRIPRTRAMPQHALTSLLLKKG
jgi:hypothetical protein